MKPSLWKIIALAVVLGTGVACQKKNAQPEQAPQAPAVSRTPFTPPADSALTLAQLKKWAACNTLLDSLTYLYADSFKTSDAGARLRFQNDFAKAQDMLCVRGGLSGGYDEYLWIRKSMGTAKNRTVLDSMGMQIY